ncbi:MAG TPA: hypothetical protein VGG01_11990 [Xanthobacteraceae bacterium]
MQVTNITGVATESLNLSTLFYRFGTAEGAPATATVTLVILWIS